MFRVYIGSPIYEKPWVARWHIDACAPTWFRSLRAFVMFSSRCIELNNHERSFRDLWEIMELLPVQMNQAGHVTHEP